MAPSFNPPPQNPFGFRGNAALNPAKQTTPLPEHLELVMHDAKASRDEASLGWENLGLSSALHVGFIVFIWLAFVLVDLFNWELGLFKLPELDLTPKTQLEYVIINNDTPETPRDKNTRNRAEVSSRSGGEKSDRAVQSEAQRQAGGQPSQAQQASRAGGGNARPQQQASPAPTPSRTPAKNQGNGQPSPQKSKASGASSRTSPTPTEAPIAVTAPKGSTPTPGTSKASPNPDDFGLGDPGPVLTAPSSSGGGGAPTRVTGGSGSVAGPGNSNANRAASAQSIAGAGGNSRLSSGAASGGGGGLAGVDALPEPDLSPYIAQVNARIRRNWTPPDAPSSTVAVYNLRIARNGQLIGLSLKRSSGNANFDAVAKSAVQVSAPFTPLPSGVRDPFIDIEFYFDYNKLVSR